MQIIVNDLVPCCTALSPIVDSYFEHLFGHAANGYSDAHYPPNGHVSLTLTTRVGYVYFWIDTAQFGVLGMSTCACMGCASQAQL